MICKNCSNSDVLSLINEKSSYSGTYLEALKNVRLNKTSWYGYPWLSRSNNFLSKDILY